MRDNRNSLLPWNVLVFLMLLVFADGAGGSEWHVSKVGLDDVSNDQQVRNIQQGIERSQPGDKIIIHGGVYREKVVIEKGGTKQAPITICAAEGGFVVITGADRLTDLKRHSDNESENIYICKWPYTFISWVDSHTHPNDDYHNLIGRCEQVFVNSYALKQVLTKEKLSRGTFYADIDAQQLYLWAYNNADISGDRDMVEASTRDTILQCEGDFIHIKGLRFRYAANKAQQGAVDIEGDDCIVQDGVFEWVNSCGVEFSGERIEVKNCVFQNNGQLGFSAGNAHGLKMAGCVVCNNNIKGFNRGWEAGGNKITRTRDMIIEDCVFHDNFGHGIWFDISNENCEVRNCLIADNQNAGIFYEISYSLHAHDNVIVGNGFAFDPDAWGANAGISLSSSENCIVERNLLVGNKEGISLREQKRSTRRLGSRTSEEIWNKGHIVRNNVLAYNQDAQVWGWFDIDDERHWPESMQKQHRAEQADDDADNTERTKKFSLEDLRLTFEDNLYCPGPGRELFIWGARWKRSQHFDSLDDIQKILGLEKNSFVGKFNAANISGLDLRVKPNSAALTRGCYPKGEVPRVILGILK